MNILRFMIIGLLIGLSSCFTSVTIHVLVSNDGMITGNELVEQLIIAATLGVTIGLISLLFTTERFGFSLQLLIHFVAITLSVFVAGYFGEWYDLASIFSIMSLFISILVIYSISWGIYFLLLKRDVEEMNDFIQKRRQQQK